MANGPSRTTVLPEPPLLGREDELDQVLDVLSTARSGPLRAIVVEGEGGIGKSRLIREVQARADDLGFRLLAGAAEELAQHQPFSALAELVRSELPGVLDELDGTLTGFVVTERLVSALEQIAAGGPILLSIDDLHWADLSTLNSIGTLVRRIADLPLVLLGTLRPQRPPEVDRLLDLLSRSGLTMVRLPALTEQARTELATSVLGAAPGPLLRKQLSATAGNPLFIIELLRAGAQDDVIAITDSVAELTTSALPARLRQTLMRRYSHLTEPTRQLLCSAAILGRFFAIQDLAVVCGAPAVTLTGRLREAIAAGLVVESGDRLAFKHDLFRLALYEDTPAALRAYLHRETGYALAAVGASATRVAEQLLLGDPDSPDTVEMLWRAARESAALSAPLAVRWYERALAGQAVDDARRAAMTAELAPLLVVVGRVAEAQQAAAETIATVPEPAVAVRLRVTVAHALTRQGRWAQAREQIEAGVARCDSPTAEAIALAPNTFLRLIMGDVSAAVEAARRSRAVAARVHNTLAEATCLMTLTLGAGAVGDADRAIAFGQECLALSRQLNTSFQELVLPNVCLGVAYLDADRTTEAAQRLWAGIDRATRLHTPGVIPYLQANLAIVLLHTGAWDDAQAQAEGCLALSHDTGTRWDLHVLAILARIAIARGDLPTAGDLLDAAERALTEEVMGANWVFWVKALLHEAQGQHAAAADLAHRAWLTVPELRFLHTNWPLPADLVRIALRAGADEFATDVVDATEAAAARNGTASAAGAALRCRALLTGDPDTALAALAAYAGSPRPVEQAMVMAEAAGALAMAGRGDEAGPLGRDALERLTALGMSPDAEPVAALRQQVGLRRAGRRVSRPATGWAALTATEQAVTSLVAQGLSNPAIAARLFISRYTVETHLKHVFAKLGISSRVALAAEAIRRDG